MPGIDVVSPSRRAALGLLSGRWPLVSAFFCLAYVALDWLSYIHPVAPFDITPWNPPTGLGFALVLLLGRKYMPLLALAPLLSDVVLRDQPLPWWLEIACALVIGSVYSCALYFLTAARTRFDPALGSIGDLLLLLAASAISAAITACAYVGLLTTSEMLPYAQFTSAALRFWIGDVIGIMIFTPFLLIWGLGRMPQLGTAEDGLFAVAIVVAVTLVVSLPASSQFQLFYLLFLPIVWIALRSGLAHVTIGLLGVQLAVVIALQYMQETVAEVISFQILMLVLAATGLLMGAAVSQQRRAETQLRLQQEALARVSRLGSMGALGTAIAHEVNQPLSAIALYADVLSRELEKDVIDRAVATEAARKAVAQVTRAAEIIKRLRDMIRLGQSEAGPNSVRVIFDETSELLRDDIERFRARLTITMASGLPDVLADRVQVEQVLVNLVRNSLEATTAESTRGRRIRIDAANTDGDTVTIAVRDDGPGFPPESRSGEMIAFSSTKPDGMGVGLIICRSIVEAHGGRLWIDRQGPGGIVMFTLRAVR